MLRGLRDDCKIGHLDMRCSGQILCNVDVLKSTKISKIDT